MLVRFEATNVRSFRDSFELSFVATSMAEKNAVREVSWQEKATRSNKLELVPVAAIFGANASGKSNVLRAIGDMRAIVLRSFRSWTRRDRTDRHPFRLDARSSKKPSRFEVEVILDGVLHAYGFALDDQRILEEWAYHYPKGQRRRIFERAGDKIRFGATVSTATTNAELLVRDNALFLSTAVALRGDDLRPLYEWFEQNLLFAEEGNRHNRQFFTAKQLEDDQRRERILRLLRAADLGIVDLEAVDRDEIPEDMRDKMEQIVAILTDGEESSVDFSDLPGPVHLVHRGTDGHTASFSSDDESLGTTVWLGLAGPIIDALDDGTVLLADELDASLHPALVEQIVHLFQDPESNPHGAQLIFNSHDAHLLGDSQKARILGRDQIWFTEKDRDGSSRLYPLSDLNPRKEEAVGRRYLAGRYGAVPILTAGDFEDAARFESVR